MEANAQLLNYIYDVAQMGADGTEQIMNTASDARYKELLRGQYEDYKQIQNEAAEKLAGYGLAPKGSSPIANLSRQVMTSMKTMNDKSPSHLSDLMIQGTTMGVTDAIKRLHEYRGCDHDIAELGGRLLHMQQDNIGKLKTFL